MAIDQAEVCLERCVERATRPEYDVIGLSAVFEFQLPGALAIARRVKERRPDMAIMLGGAACIGSPGDHLARWFPCVDAVCRGEGDRIIGPLVRALRARRDPSTAASADPLRSVPGIAYTDTAGEWQRNPDPPLVTELDWLPVPDYRSFVDDLRASEWGDELCPQMLFETSRGCWWGEKHLCTFCGLNVLGLTYRRKSAARALEEIRELHVRYPEADLLVAVDNILEMDYLQDVLPELGPLANDPDRPLRIFYEIKSNLRRDQVERLAAAGIRHVQPGIESFSDEMLQLMRKGSTGIRQIQVIKHLYEHDVTPQYGMILRNPGEEAAWYDDMTALVPWIEHLPPPKVNSMVLERFSPYFMEQAPTRDHERPPLRLLPIDVPRSRGGDVGAGVHVRVRPRHLPRCPAGGGVQPVYAGGVPVA